MKHLASPVIIFNKMLLITLTVTLALFSVLHISFIYFYLFKKICLNYTLRQVYRKRILSPPMQGLYIKACPLQGFVHTSSHLFSIETNTEAANQLLQLLQLLLSFDRSPGLFALASNTPIRKVGTSPWPKSLVFVLETLGFN